MTTYAEAGVDIDAGDKASKGAYAHAKSTFSSRKGMIGEPVVTEDGFSGLVDMGAFYMTQCCDTVGTKITVAEKIKKFDGLGYDLLCMVADDAICAGAEVVSITNTFETQKVNQEEIDAMMASLAAACREQKVVIPGGEVAEVGDMTNGTGWGADAVGIVKKDSVVTGKTVSSGQKIIGLQGRVLRCNGLSLARRICKDQFGGDWTSTEWKDGITWGEVLLTPSKIFHRTLLDSVLGDFAGKRKFNVHGVVHVTGGGIPGNFPRIFSNKSLGADFYDLHEPHDVLKDLVRLGNVDESEAYKTWHCGTAMMLVVDETDAVQICDAINAVDPETNAKIVGEINDSSTISLKSKFSQKNISF